MNEFGSLERIDLRKAWANEASQFTPWVAENLKVFSMGTNYERRAFTRLFVRKIDLDPDNGNILMHLFSCPPWFNLQKTETPASNETGVRFNFGSGDRI